MEENTLTVLLIEDSPQYAQLVQHWLANAAGGAGFVLNWTDCLADGMSRLERGGVDVILLDLGLPDCSGMDTFTQTRNRAPRTPIVILSSADSESLALQMIQEGAEDFLVKSTCQADVLARAVRRAVVRRKSHGSVAHASTQPSRVISFVGVKGGIGTTTLACTLAAELRLQTGQRTLIADLDPSGGLVSFLSGVDCQYSMRDAIGNFRRLDATVWESIVAQNPDGLHVISGSNLDEERIEDSRLRDVLAFTRPLYAWTVLDLGRVSPKSMSLLGTDDEVFVVTGATIPALYSAKRTVEALRAANVDADRIRLIVNHVGEKQMVSGDAMNHMFGVPVYATVPNDPAELHQACVQKRLPGVQSNIRKAVAGRARKVTGLPEQRKSGLTSLVSFARFRRPSETPRYRPATDWREAMDRDVLILLVDDNPACIDSIRRVLGDKADHYRLRRVADVPTALARVWGGGVDLVLVNLPPAGATDGDRLLAFRELRGKASSVPIVLLCGSGDEGLAEIALREGALDCLVRDACEADLSRGLRSAAGKAQSSPAASRPVVSGGKRGKLLAFMGSRGGVGTTTVALNVAAVLAQNHSVILAELHSELGILPHYFQPHRSVRDLGDLLQAEGRAEKITPYALEACLWPVKNVPGLQVLYGSRNPEKSSDLKPDLAISILTIAAGLADYVVIDLPVSLSETNRAVVESADCLALVVERDPISVQAAKLILSCVDSWKAARLSIGTVILNRAALVSPMSFADIDAELHIPTLGVIPPASDLCAAAQHAHAPLVTLDTDSLASVALRDLSRTIAELVPSVWPPERAESGPLAAYHVGQQMSRAGVR